MRRISRSDAEIDNLLNTASAWEDHGGSAVPGMSYEQGVRAGLDWVFGDINEPPIEEMPPDEEE